MIIKGVVFMIWRHFKGGTRGVFSEAGKGGFSLLEMSIDKVIHIIDL